MKRSVIAIALTAAAMALTLPLSAHAAAPGWSSIDGEWYYYNSDGSPANGVQVIDGEAYTFDGSGRMVLDGVHRDGMEDDLLEKAYVTTSRNWDQAQLALDELNRTRAENGAGPVSLDYDFCLLSAYRALHMIKHNYQTHFKPDGTSYVDELATLYYHTPMDLAEVFVFHLHSHPLRLSVDEVRSTSFVKLLNSESHRRSLLNPERSRLGVCAVVSNDEFTPGYYAFVFLEVLL